MKPTLDELIAFADGSAAARQAAHLPGVYAAIDGYLRELKAIREAKGMPELRYQTHTVCDDAWYSCPKSAEGCADEREGDFCTCGADDYNAQLDKLRAHALHLKAENERLRAELEGGK